MDPANPEVLAAYRAGTRRRHGLLIVAMLIATPVIAGCAQIKSFSVAPGTVCLGEKVVVDWKASGDVVLESHPPVEGAGGGPPEGFRSIVPKESTRFVLKVPGLLRSTQREWDVEVLPDRSSRLLGGIAQCGGDPPLVSTFFTIGQKDISARVRAVSIANHYARPLYVGKGGQEAEIPPNGRTDAFKNLPVSGRWTVRAPVAEDESCDGALDAVRARLTITIQMSCAEESDGAP